MSYTKGEGIAHKEKNPKVCPVNLFGDGVEALELHISEYGNFRIRCLAFDLGLAGAEDV
jgi:hypothetical protein